MEITAFNAAGLSWYVSPVAGELTKTLKSGKGTLQFLQVCNTTASKIYVFVFDNTAASGTLLFPPIPVAANDHFFILTMGRRFTTGCTVSSSSTQKSYTGGGANDLHIHAGYG